MKIAYTKENDVKIIKYLCFRLEDPTLSNCTFMDLRSIAEFLGKSYAYVQRICTELRRGKFRE